MSDQGSIRKSQLRGATWVLVLCFSPVFATAPGAVAPFEAGKPELGKPLAQSHCVSCHAKAYANQPERMYTRSNRRVDSARALLEQIRRCNANLGLQWFPEDEEHVAAFLNLNWYKFK
jgi:hypothetical protein